MAHLPIVLPLVAVFACISIYACERDDPARTAHGLPVEHMDNRTFKIYNINTDNVVQVDFRSHEDGADVSLSPNLRVEKNQYWRVESNEDETRRLIADHSGKALSSENGSTRAGSALEQRSWDGSEDQKWNFIVNEDESSYRLENVASGLVIGIANEDAAGQSRLELQEWIDGNHQKWMPSDTYLADNFLDIDRTDESIVAAVNVGGEQYTTPDGTVFESDRTPDRGSTTIKSTEREILGTHDDPLYQTLREGSNFAYQFSLEPGKVYHMRLHFAENDIVANPDNPGFETRAFNVNIESEGVDDFHFIGGRASLDIHRAVGSNRALARELKWLTPDDDGNLLVEFSEDGLLGHRDFHIEEGYYPTVAAIEIIEARDNPDIGLGETRLAQTPPMGFNTWNAFRCDINQNIIHEIADAMVDEGLLDAGYEYLNIDDCFQSPHRNIDNDIWAHPETFPDGMKALGDYIHGKGLKYGMYTSSGESPCATTYDDYPAPGSLHMEEHDAQTFSEWGIDYLKYDNCRYNMGRTNWERFASMGKGLLSADRDIVFSQCSKNEDNEVKYSGQLANLWRMTGDIHDRWDSIIDIIDMMDGYEAFTTWGHWNDPDMLQAGNPGLNEHEATAHFAMWSMLAAPLLIGTDVRDLEPWERDLFTNRDLIAINQDMAGLQAFNAADHGSEQVWVKPMTDNRRAVALLNRDDNEAHIATTAEEIGMPSADSYRMRDAIEQSDAGSTDGTISATVPGRSIALYIVSVESGKENIRPGRYLSDWHWMAAYQEEGDVRRDAAFGDTPLMLDGTEYEKGIGTHAHSQVVINLDRDYESFEAVTGIDDGVENSVASAVFEVWGDGELLYQSSRHTLNSHAESISVDVNDIETLKLVTRRALPHDSNVYARTNWADARIE